MVVYQDGTVIRDRVQKICDSFMGQRFEVPPLNQIRQSMAQTFVQIEKAEGLLKMSVSTLSEYLRTVNRA